MDETAYRSAEQKLWASAGLAPRESWADIPRLGARVRIQEVGQGEPVLFLHPVLNAGACWVRLLPFVPGFRRIVIDRPGCGLSPRTEMRSELRPFMVELIRGILDALELDQAHLVASSFGSYCALALARACPDRVSRIVHLSCPALVPGMSVPAPLRLWGVPLVNRALMRLLALRPELFLRGMAQAVDRLPGEVTAWWLSLVRDTETLRNDVVCNERMLGLGGIKRSVQLTADDLRHIAAPNLLLWGDQDPMGSPEVGRRLVSMMPSARLEVFPDAAHLIWFDAPEAAGKATRAFLAESTREELAGDCRRP